jgi:hypothetical protein
MKINLLILFLLILFSCSKDGSILQKKENDLHKETDMYEVIQIVSKKLQIKYGLQLVGIGGGADEKGVWSLDASYKYSGPKILEIEEARKIILNCIEEFLWEANNNLEFRPAMKEFPFSSKNIGILIITYDEKGNLVHFPYISVISHGDGIINYKSLDTKITLPYVNNRRETYEEALALSQKTAFSLNL